MTARGCFGRLGRGAATCCTAVCHHLFKLMLDSCVFPREYHCDCLPLQTLFSVLLAQHLRWAPSKSPLGALGLCRAARRLLASCFMLFVCAPAKEFFSKGSTSLPTAFSRQGEMMHSPISDCGATVLVFSHLLGEHICLLVDRFTFFS